MKLTCIFFYAVFTFWIHVNLLDYHSKSCLCTLLTHFQFSSISYLVVTLLAGLQLWYLWDWNIWNCLQRDFFRQRLDWCLETSTFYRIAIQKSCHDNIYLPDFDEKEWIRDSCLLSKIESYNLYFRRKICLFYPIHSLLKEWIRQLAKKNTG